MKSRIVRCLPFFFLFILAAYTIYVFLKNGISFSTPYISTFFLIGVNALLYFFRFKYAIILTGIIIVLSIFNTIALFPEIQYSSYFIKVGTVKLSTPNFQWKPVILFIFYLLINLNFLKANFSNSRKERF